MSGHLKSRNGLLKWGTGNVFLKKCQWSKRQIKAVEHKDKRKKKIFDLRLDSVLNSNFTLN